MYCRKCGVRNDDNAYQCIACGAELHVTTAQPQPLAPPEKIKNYLVESILVTLLCCIPLGIAAIINAAQVNSKLQAGDIPGARAASANAKKFCIASLVAGLVVAVVYFILIVSGVVKP